MPIPHVPSKYASRSLFQPGDFIEYTRRHGMLAEGTPPEAVILSYQRSLFDYVEKNHDVETKPGYFSNQLRYMKEYDGSIAIAGHFGIGSPAAAVMIEELIAFGVRRFISVGTAGALSRDCPVGSLLLCDAALRDEGVSFHYLPDNDDYCHPSTDLTERLATCLSDEGLSFTRGHTWTTDAIYRETEEELKVFRTKGVKVVEMEASALFAVAKYRGVDIASCFSISDTLAEDAWRPEFHSETTAEGLEHIFRAAVQALRK